MNSPGHVLIVGAGPLPSADAGMLCSYNLRTAKLAWLLERHGIPARVCALDLFAKGGGDRSMAQQGLTGPYELLPEAERGALVIRQRIDEGVRAILAVGGKAAALVAGIDPDVPIWADMPGWLMSEAQLKAVASGDDSVIAHYKSQEDAVLRRADKISVVCDNQLRVTMGELGILGRLSRRNAGYELLHRIPSLGFAWTPLLGGNGHIPTRPVVPDDAQVLLWSGSLNLWTDVGWLFGLLGELMTRMPKLHFVASGLRIGGFNDESCDSFERLIRAAPFADRCHLAGWLPFREAVAWLSRATLGLCIDGENVEVAHGSRTRIVEMAAHGLPVAATVGTELTLDLSMEGAIVALHPRERERWAEQILDVLQSPDELHRLREAARDHVMGSYGIEKVCGDLLTWLASPTHAPDVAFRKRLASLRPPSSVPLGTPDAGLRKSRPMVTWRPQAEVEGFATTGLRPAFVRRSARLARRALAPLLSRRPTRLPVLAAWNVASRVSSKPRLANWQSWIDATRPHSPSNGSAAALDERLAADAARRIYGRAVARGTPGTLKAANVLLAGQERNELDDLAAWPQRIEIEPSSACNIRCRQCQLTHYDRPVTNMTVETYGKMAPYLRYASIVEFIGRGEPTLNKHLEGFMRAATEQGCFVRMFTNGTRLGADLSASMVQAGVDEIVLSLLGGDRRSYEWITASDGFDLIVDNFRTLRDIKRHLGSETPRLSICSTLLEGSLDSAPDVVRTAASLEIPTIHFGASYIVMPEMESQSLLKLPRERVLRVFDRCREVARQLGIAIVLPPLAGDAPSVPPPLENKYGCLKPWQSVLVRADGQVEVCSYNRKIVGDLRGQSFPEIWNGAEFKAFRRGEVRHHGVDYCDMCYHRAFRGRTAGKATHFPYGITFDGYR